MKHPQIDRDNYIHVLVSKLKELASDLNKTPSRSEFVEYGATDYQIRLAGGFESLLKMAGLESRKYAKKKEEDFIIVEAGPKVLLFDIETSPMELYGYGLFDQNFSLAQIKKDWYVLSWAAKWLGDSEDKVMYADVRDNEDLSNDYGIISQIWQLLDEADIVITQNGIRFDSKKLNARFVKHGFPPPSSYRHIDTLRLAKKSFAFTSNKLEYMTDLLCVKFKKLKHSEFQGFELWRGCLERNPAAWVCMEKYNRYDVLSLEELYLKLRVYGTPINFNVYYESIDNKCDCGCPKLNFNGYYYTNASKREKYSCEACSMEYVSKQNLLSKEKRKNLMK